MLKITNATLHSWSQSFLDEMDDVDWGDGQPKRRVTKKDETPVPHGQQGAIGEDAFEEFEPGSAEAVPQREDKIVDDGIVDPRMPEEREIPEKMDVPEEIEEIIYDGSINPDTGVVLDQQQQAYDGIDNDEVISFDYTDRYGHYAGHRTVEPHYTFVASTTGNEVLVTFDQSVGDIRAFIVGNIHPFGVRYNGVQFSPRGEIMKGIY